ncbi:MAG: uridylate kinase [Planctomycetaceae bacterium]|nr:uridylate kinase [Planctomycetaceae bacterium]
MSPQTAPIAAREPSFETPLVVYKVGGSLLGLPGLVALIESIISQRPGRVALLVAGGGAAADVVREWDQAHRLGDERAHELALDAMRLSQSLLERLMPTARLVRNRRQMATAAARRERGILCADCFLRWGESTGFPPLPHSWRVTSDSIAAWTACLLEADELVLLKSIPVPVGQTFKQAAQAGLVDQEFPAQAAPLRLVNWVDGHAASPEIRSWHGC